MKSCKWINGDPMKAHTWCCEPSVFPYSYCNFHMQKAYKKHPYLNNMHQHVITDRQQLEPAPIVCYDVKVEQLIVSTS